jgi:hypothetical protein
MGVDFTIIEGKGPKILSPVRDYSSAERINPLYDVEKQVPFLGPILKVGSSFSFIKSHFNKYVRFPVVAKRDGR